jgi:hypothetical protein
MAILNNSNAISPSGYDVNNSLRLRSSATAYLNRTPASSGNRQIFTFSAWVKRGSLGIVGTLLSGGATAGTGTAQFIGFDTDNTFFFSNYNVGNLQTTQVFRDPSAWYHMVIAIDTTQATAANRIKMYVNGSQITAFSSSTYPSQNTNLYININEIQTIGRASWSSLYLFDGYLAEVNFVDGQQLTPSDFGSTDTTTGVWKPKPYSGTYGTNGFYLKFSDIATTSGSNAGLGKDFSGNTNYWTTNNISVTSGVTYDAMTDVPTNTSATVANYCVMNPLQKGGSISASDGNLTVVNTLDSKILGTFGMSSGKWYWEATVQTTSDIVGIALGDSSLSAFTGGDAKSWGYYFLNGNKYTNASATAYGASCATGNIVGIAFDADAGTLVFYKNNVSQGTAYSSLTSGPYFPAAGNGNANTVYMNFGQRPFSYTPPTGYVALNTYNLPTPTILQGNKYMDATTYTGTGSTQSITNAGSFKPDLVWTKSRSNAYNNVLCDSVRGVAKGIFSDLTNAEDTASPTSYVQAFNSNGFSVNIGTNSNANGATYVGWQWQAGQGSTSSNTSGSITSTVSVNTTAGFSVVTYTGTGANATVGHGLGVAPSMMIIKQRNAAQSWSVYHASLGATKRLYLNLTDAVETTTTAWNSTAPTSSVYSVGTSAATNGNGNTYVAYCWAEIAGFSRFGSYTGNSSSDGVFVYTGFRPKFVMVKISSASNWWYMYDSSRSPYNTSKLILYANQPDAEATSSTSDIDFLSNGFKLRGADSGVNGSGTYIYMAFAEFPTKNALAR